MLREAIFAHLRGQQDLEVVPLPDRHWPSAEAIAAEGLDVLITEGAGRAAPPDGTELLYTLPRLKIVFLGPGGRDATLALLVLELEHLPDVSAETLLRAIRGAPASGAGGPG